MENQVPFLFIDDSKADNKYLALFIKIKKLPINPHFESGGNEALQYLFSLKNGKFPKVIFVDINMPLMNGFEFVDRYRRHFSDHHPDTHVFITSSSIQLSDLERANSHPAVAGFIEKPFNLRQFESKVQPLIERDKLIA